MAAKNNRHNASSTDNSNRQNRELPPDADQPQSAVQDASIVLEAVQNISNINPLHDLLLHALERGKTLEIDASAVTSVDTATLQLLTVVKQEAVKTGKKVLVDFPSEKFIDSARLLGLAELLEVDQPASGLF